MKQSVLTALAVLLGHGLPVSGSLPALAQNHQPNLQQNQKQDQKQDQSAAFQAVSLSHPPSATHPGDVPPTPDVPTLPDDEPFNERDIRAERRRIVSDLLSEPGDRPPRVMVTCRPAQAVESWQSESRSESWSEGWSENRSESWSESWSESRSQSWSESERAHIHELLSEEDRTLTVDIQGNCEQVRIHLGQAAQDPTENWREGWHEEHSLGDILPWLTRPGSGWDWFLRDRGGFQDNRPSWQP